MATGYHDNNHTPVLMAVSSVDGKSPVVVWADPTTHRILVTGSTAFVNNEIVAGSGTAWTLAQAPLVGTEHIYANGQRLTPGIGNDYTISGTAITTANSFVAGTILADYQIS